MQINTRDINNSNELKVHLRWSKCLHLRGIQEPITDTTKLLDPKENSNTKEQVKTANAQVPKVKNGKVWS